MNKWGINAQMNAQREFATETWEMEFTKKFWQDTPLQHSKDGEGEFHLLIGEFEPYHGLFQTYFRTFRTVR